MVNIDAINYSDMEEAQVSETTIGQLPAVLLRLYIGERRNGIMHVGLASLKQIYELVRSEGLPKLNICDEVERVGSELHCKQPDFEGNHGRTNLVNEFMPKGILENHLFTEHSAIEPEYCNKRLKIAMEVVGDLAFQHALEEQDMSKDFKVKNILSDLKVSNMLLDRNTKSTSTTNADDFTTLNIPAVSQQRGKTNLEIEKTVGCRVAPRAKNLVEMACEWWRNRSYLPTWPMKVRNELRSNVHIWLLIFTFLATTTFHIALKFYLPVCRLQEGYDTNSSLYSVFPTENQSSYSTRILLMVNSVAFFLSVGMLMILFNELPFRPLLLVLLFSMIGSYMCTLMNPMNPSLCSS